MHLLSFRLLLPLLALGQVAYVCAFPSTLIAKDVAVVANVQHTPELSERAPKKEVPLNKETGLATWRGYRSMPGVFNIQLSPAELKEYAKDTFASIRSKTTDYTLLVSVIYVPGHGIAAGTIWTGTSSDFTGLASFRAPCFWASLSGVQQQLQPWANTRHMWHAEAVAAVTAEDEFRDGIFEGRWPEGTMIYTYGRVNNVVQSKASCSGTSSSVTVPCREWLDRLGINVIDP
jgi:hypothetical protein